MAIKANRKVSDGIAEPSLLYQYVLVTIVYVKVRLTPSVVTYCIIFCSYLGFVFSIHVFELDCKTPLSSRLAGKADTVRGNYCNQTKEAWTESTGSAQTSNSATQQALYGGKPRHDVKVKVKVT